MPIYTYRCENCGVQFERSQKFSDAPMKVCPECHKKTLRKVYTPVGIVFKGSGFYVTDHRSSSSTSRPASSHNEKNSSSDNRESSSSSSDNRESSSSSSESRESSNSSSETKAPASESAKSTNNTEK